MILAIFLAVLGLGLYGFLHKLARRLEQRDYERERFALAVAQELDRLDKAIKENNASIAMAEAMLEPQQKWWGRN